jgi:tRNA-dihydrouridine synthase
MMAWTGCDGVVIGRGCLGRPWLFRDLDGVFDDGIRPAVPTLGEVATMMSRHAELLVECFGRETQGLLDFRKHVGWYLKGFTVGAELRRDLATAGTLAGLRDHLSRLPAAQPWPGPAADSPRGTSSERARVQLPDGWLDDPEDGAVPLDAELDISGG